MRLPKLAILLIAVCIIVPVAILIELLGAKDFDAAESECKKAIDENKNNPLAAAKSYYFLGQTYVAQRKYEDARPAFLSALEIAQNRNEPVFKTCIGLLKNRIALCDFHAGKLDEAFQTYKELIWEYTEPSNASDVRLFTDGQFETLHIGADSIVMLVYCLSDPLGYSVKQEDKIIPTLEDIATRHPSNRAKAEALYQMAIHYRKSDNTSAAMEIYQKLANLYPDDIRGSQAREKIGLKEKRKAEREGKL